MLGQQVQRMRAVAAFQRMVDGWHWAALGLVPTGGGQVQAGYLLRLLTCTSWLRRNSANRLW